MEQIHETCIHSGYPNISIIKHANKVVRIQHEPTMDLTLLDTVTAEYGGPPAVWNALGWGLPPMSGWSTAALTSFKKHLKTLMFHRAFGSVKLQQK